MLLALHVQAAASICASIGDDVATLHAKAADIAVVSIVACAEGDNDVSGVCPQSRYLYKVDELLKGDMAGVEERITGAARPNACMSYLRIADSLLVSWDEQGRLLSARKLDGSHVGLQSPEKQLALLRGAAAGRITRVVMPWLFTKDQDNCRLRRASGKGNFVFNFVRSTNDNAPANGGDAGSGSAASLAGRSVTVFSTTSDAETVPVTIEYPEDYPGRNVGPVLDVQPLVAGIGLDAHWRLALHINDNATDLYPIKSTLELPQPFVFFRFRQFRRPVVDALEAMIAGQDVRLVAKPHMPAGPDGYRWNGRVLTLEDGFVVPLVSNEEDTGPSEFLACVRSGVADNL